MDSGWVFWSIMGPIWGFGLYFAISGLFSIMFWDTLYARGHITLGGNQFKEILLTFPNLLWLASKPTAKFAFKWAKKPFTLFGSGVPHFKELLMKRKVFTAVVLMTLGYFVPSWLDGAKNWLTAPPNPPGSEAVKLAESLQEANGWRVERRDNGIPFLIKGNITIRPCTWTADVEINTANANPAFSRSDLKLIQAAAEKCIRKLAQKSIDAASSTSAGSISEEGENLVFKLQDGKEFRMKKSNLE